MRLCKQNGGGQGRQKQEEGGPLREVFKEGVGGSHANLLLDFLIRRQTVSIL